MGIDYHGLNFLAFAAQQQPFGETVTLGRQGIHVPNYQIKKVLKSDGSKRYGPFCEDLLIDEMGSSSVDSFDNSDFEQASFLHDFNKPLDHGRQYDTVIDSGTLEHIFNVPVALDNVGRLCKQGGQILHLLPGNNFSGHGFWQFSPELFFSLYSTANGFSDTAVFIAELDNDHFWFKASAPSNGVRVEYTSKSRSYVLVRTRKVAARTGDAVQQSDYVYEWDSASVAARPAAEAAGRGLRAKIESLPLVATLAWTVLKTYRELRNPMTNARLHRLAPSNRHFTKVPIADLHARRPARRAAVRRQDVALG